MKKTLTKLKEINSNGVVIFEDSFEMQGKDFVRFYNSLITLLENYANPNGAAKEE